MKALYPIIVCAFLGACTSLPGADLELVRVEIVVSEGSPQLLERIVVEPLEHALHRWSEIDSIKSTMTENNVRIELGFRHAPTHRELSDVRAAVDVATSDSGLRPVSVRVTVRPPAGR